MELLKILNSPAFTQWIAESLAVLFLVGGFAAVAVGLGLFFSPGGTLRLFGTINRWVSMRHVARPLEVLRDTRPAVLRYRRWIAAAFILGGAFALYGLIAQFDAKGVIFIYRLDFFKPSFATWLVDSARWILIIGNIAAIAIGLALAFSPAAIARLEAEGARWYSERQVIKGANDMHLPVDQRVASYPRYSGLIMAFFGLVLIGIFGIMLFGTR